MCWKVALSKSDAERAAQQLRDMGEDDPKAPLNAYKCKDCGRWHAGHNKRGMEPQA